MNTSVNVTGCPVHQAMKQIGNGEYACGCRISDHMRVAETIATAADNDAQCIHCDAMFPSAGLLPLCAACTRQHAAEIGATPLRAIQLISAFAGAFQRSGLYETGFAEPWQAGGATSANDRETMLRALSYVHGSADTSRLACLYLGRGWRIAHLMGTISGTLSLCIENGDSASKVQRLIAQYTGELKALIADPSLSDASLLKP